MFEGDFPDKLIKIIKFFFFFGGRVGGKKFAENLFELGFVGDNDEFISGGVEKSESLVGILIHPQ